MTTHHSPTTPNWRRTAAAAVAAASAFAALFAATAPAQAREAPRPIGPRLQAILDRAVKSPETTFPGVALRVRVPDQGTWSGAAGKANVETGRRMRPNDRFRAGSITKTFVAAATLQLVEKGRFALDDPLPAVLPSRVTARFPDAAGITVRMLLNHTSGLGDYDQPGWEAEIAADPMRRWTVGELLDRAAAQPPTSAPGERFAYANVNYTLLGLVLEHATGKPWRAVVRERVIERLHLAHTSLPKPGTVPSGRRIAHGYDIVDGALRDFTAVDPSMAGAAGGHAMLTTTRDLTRFQRALLAGRLFERRETLRELRGFGPTDNADFRVGYALGLERYLLPGGVEIVGHMGSSAGSRAVMFHLPAQDIDLTFVITSRDDPMPVLGPVLELLLAEEAA